MTLILGVLAGLFVFVVVLFVLTPALLLIFLPFLCSSFYLDAGCTCISWQRVDTWMNAAFDHMFLFDTS